MLNYPVRLSYELRDSVYHVRIPNRLQNTPIAHELPSGLQEMISFQQTDHLTMIYDYFFLFKLISILFKYN